MLIGKVLIHVLEHVIDDRKAMGELFRVLRPDGWAILQSPIDSQRDTTFEDPKIVSPQDRERAFGQKDHVRIYGRDYQERLEQAGFSVTVESYAKELGADIADKYSLIEDEGVYYCAKPLTSGYDRELSGLAER